MMPHAKLQPSAPMSIVRTSSRPASAMLSEPVNVSTMMRPKRTSETRSRGLRRAGAEGRGDIGYFSDDRQHVCFKLGTGAKFARRKYFKPPPGSRDYGTGGGRAISSGHGRPDIVCDADHTRNGYQPRAMPRVEVPAERFAEPADDD